MRVSVKNLTKRTHSGYNVKQLLLLASNKHSIQISQNIELYIVLLEVFKAHHFVPLAVLMYLS